MSGVIINGYTSGTPIALLILLTANDKGIQVSIITSKSSIE
jgi:chorismate synthase